MTYQRPDLTRRSIQMDATGKVPASKNRPVLSNDFRLAMQRIKAATR